MSSPLFLTILTVILWSTCGIFAKSVDLSGNATLYIIAVLSALLSFQLTSWKENKRIFLPSSADLFSKRFLFASLGFGFYWLWMGLSVARSNNASLPIALQCSWPLFNSLFISLFFLRTKSKQKNKLLSKSVVGLFLGFAGVLILFLGDQQSESHTSLSSACFALCAGASFGLYSAYSSTIRTQEHINFLILSCISGLIVLVPWALLNHSNLANLSVQQVGIAIAFGVFVDGLGTYLWTKVNSLVAQRGTDISSMTSVTLALPFLSAFLLYLFFAEQQVFQISYLIGLLFLLSGISVCNRK